MWFSLTVFGILVTMYRNFLAVSRISIEVLPSGRSIKSWECIFYLLQEFLPLWTMKITVSWEVTPRSLVEVCRLFGEKHYFHIQGRRVSQNNEQDELGAALLVDLHLAGCLFGMLFYPEDTKCLWTSGCRCITACLHDLLFDSEDWGSISFETSVNFYRITRRHIPINNTLHSHRYENLKSNILSLLNNRHLVAHSI
jgi:hypothetical protein